MAKQRTLDRPQKGDMVYMALVYVLAVVAFVATLYPFLYVIAVSFSDSKAVYGGEVYLFPKDVTLAGYEQVLNQPDLWLKYGNTILYTAAGTLFNIVATTLAAYPLSPHALLRAPLFEFLYHIHDVFFRRHDPHLFVGDQSGAVQFPLGDDHSLAAIDL